MLLFNFLHFNQLYLDEADELRSSQSALLILRFIRFRFELILPKTSNVDEELAEPINSLEVDQEFRRSDFVSLG